MVDEGNKALLHGRRISSPDYGPLRDLVKHHIDSFDYMVESGLKTMLLQIKPIKVSDPLTKTELRVWIGEPDVYPPQKQGFRSTIRDALFPSECRQAKISYTGKLLVDVCFQFNNNVVISEKFNFGQLPVMLKSKICHLRKADPRELITRKEESSEVGGYFILNGLERVVRLLILPKRNFPISVVRNSFRERREGYSDKAILIRCVREDQSSVTVRLHYLNNGSARFGFWIQGREFLLPVGLLLKALVDTTDHEIYVCLTSCYNEKRKKGKGVVGTQLVGERAKIILDEVQALSLFTQSQCLQHIGEHFQPVIPRMEAESHSSVAEAVLRDYIFVHLDNNFDKFNLLIIMTQKLFSLVDQTSVPDNPDSLQNQEVLLPGHLITIYLKDKFEEWLSKAVFLLQQEINDPGKEFNLSNLADVKKVLDKNPARLVCLAIEIMLKTGRLTTQSSLDMQQRAGLTVQADRLNFLRFVSHFRAVHRGASFAGLRTTSVRKLLPEAFGFLCPVHTPDGEPCGLLNHMASTCRITSYFDSQGVTKDFFTIRKSIMNVLIWLGMICSIPKPLLCGPPEFFHVLLDGRVLGFFPSSDIQNAVAHLRKLKVLAPTMVPEDMEVGYVPLTMGGSYPGLYLFTSSSRFVRPVKNIFASEGGHDIELIGPFEQVYMEIKCPDGGDGGRRNNFPATHEEIHPTAMLSVVANLTPWSDHNQSPRNMYQCQMAKQTMGFSSQAIYCRADQKVFHLQTPQNPIVRTSAYEKYSLDEFPLGTNAIVAVLSYTGYDMEDAMILNKSSVDRGFCRGQIYQTETIDLSDRVRKSEHGRSTFRRSAADKSVHSQIDLDGLPYVGQRINPDDAYCSIYNEVSGMTRGVNLKGSECSYVDYVAVDVKNNKQPEKVNIRFRRPRNPVIGDKFSSRHGQKGVCSQLWPDIDMPFSGLTGMRPDLIINPHAFPSRMTIAMLLESIAAKGGSLNGKFVDATPFANDSDSLADHLGSLLKSKGFNYHGVEVLYSGVYGTELTCSIFMGPVYYQRLRHMVSDKFQVRSTGVVDQMTRQPIKGRKRGGGIRFGEMERDSMLAHGAAYLLHDRLHTCSDYHVADVCSACGSLMGVGVVPEGKRFVGKGKQLAQGKRIVCGLCGNGKGIEKVAMPYVFRYLATELAAMNIKISLEVSKGGE